MNQLPSLDLIIALQKFVQVTSAMIFTSLFAFLAAVIFFYAKTRFTYWKSKGVPTLAHRNTFFGDIAPVIFLKENLGKVLQNAYTEFRKNGHKFGGLYFLNNPIFLVTDPELVKLILVKDFEHFANRGVKYDVKNNPLSAHIFSLNGDNWKYTRQRLSPAFTSGKLKKMMGIIEERIDVLCALLEKKCGDEVNMYKLLERLGIDIIGVSAFGINCNTLSGENSKFHQMTTRLFSPKIWYIIKTSLVDFFKNPANLVRALTSDPVVEEFFIDLVRKTVEYRRENNVKANDFMQILIEMMTPENDEAGLSIEEITAHAHFFFISAFETQAKTINMCLYEMAKNTDLQKGLRLEIRESLGVNGKKLEFGSLMQMTLLDKMINETMRKHPSVLYVHRVCSKEYHIPNSSVVIEEGTPLLVPIFAFHHDEDYFAQPEVFDPNRFSKENVNNIKPYTYLPFGGGPRYCIGKRFALLQMKMTIVKLIQNFEFGLSRNIEDPLILDPITKNLLLSYRDDIWLTIKKVK